MYFTSYPLKPKTNRWISHLKTKKREREKREEALYWKGKKYQYILIYNRYYIITEYYINIWCYIYINYFYYVRLQSLLEESILSTYSYDPCGSPRISMYIHVCVRVYRRVRNITRQKTISFKMCSRRTAVQIVHARI